MYLIIVSKKKHYIWNLTAIYLFHWNLVSTQIHLDRVLDYNCLYKCKYTMCPSQYYPLSFQCQDNSTAAVGSEKVKTNK